jgi:hypothetical protein
MAADLSLDFAGLAVFTWTLTARARLYYYFVQLGLMDYCEPPARASSGEKATTNSMWNVSYWLDGRLLYEELSDDDKLLASAINSGVVWFNVLRREFMIYPSPARFAVVNAVISGGLVTETHLKLSGAFGGRRRRLRRKNKRIAVPARERLDDRVVAAVSSHGGAGSGQTGGGSPPSEINTAIASDPSPCLGMNVANVLPVQANERQLNQRAHEVAVGSAALEPSGGLAALAHDAGRAEVSGHRSGHSSKREHIKGAPAASASTQQPASSAEFRPGQFVALKRPAVPGVPELPNGRAEVLRLSPDRSEAFLDVRDEDGAAIEFCLPVSFLTLVA